MGLQWAMIRSNLYRKTLRRHGNFDIEYVAFHRHTDLDFAIRILSSSIITRMLAASTTQSRAEYFFLSADTAFWGVECEMISCLVASANHDATRLTLFGGQGISGVSRGHFCILPWRSHCHQGMRMMDVEHVRCYYSRIEIQQAGCRSLIYPNEYRGGPSHHITLGFRHSHSHLQAKVAILNPGVVWCANHIPCPRGLGV